ncbi:RDD domain-containing protein [Arthrobacter crystallopoietes BAB-32]|uniref:RDD domain-containing protein n=1 Tax=Arthrobacter crystallopoietes BAB-32 TaxID=1246476 RepID=N1V7C2_9MICC|nr:RDD family protein [Arthrobacter crystallopoietes]EMY34143.1 RDD domain-containing protein [Arthrobacter crystallopoietes BAB-32]
MSNIVTGEAVVLELRPASFGVRALSSMIDCVTNVLLLILALAFLAETLQLSFDAAAAQALSLTLFVFFLVILPVGVETLTRGKSLGRLIMGLRIVRDDGGSIRFRHALIRGLVGVFELYLLLGSVAFMAALFNDRSKRLGDLLAGTYSMRERVGVIHQQLPHTPPQLMPWVKLADMGRLPESLARRVSQFITQAPKMIPASRERLAVDLATETSQYVSPPPPAGTAPEMFLIAVMAERRERDFVRLSRQYERSQQQSARLHSLPFQD